MCNRVCRLKVVQVVGKRTRPVPILLTEDMYSSMNVLNATRVQCGVCEGNKFFFALPTSTTAHLRFYDVLKRVALQAKLKKPENLTTTRLRKHLATVAQVFRVHVIHLHLCAVLQFSVAYLCSVRRVILTLNKKAMLSQGNRAWMLWILIDMAMFSDWTCRG